MRLKNVLLLVLLLYSSLLHAQTETISLYPKDYFRNPLDIPIFLAGNFGECRPGHFHSGIDIKTKGVENQPVHAAADGYISRIKMEKGGFGHALYITHPNGFTTLYAHLNNFIPSVQKFLRQNQYQKESWAVDIPVSPDQFPVKKGQQIAWSGNTGASTAPHLHFEIRDTKTEHPLNPLLFGLPIIDTRSPLPTQVSLYDMNQSIYEQQAQIISLKQSENTFTTGKDIITVNTDKLGVGLSVNDFMNGSHNTLNFYEAQWYLDDQLQGSIRLDDIGYEETRYLHAYVDYKLKQENGNWYQLLFELPGNRLDHIYPSLNAQRGVITLTDAQPHKLRIELHDALGNATSIAFNVKSTGAPAAPACDTRFTVNQSNSFENPNVKFRLSDKDLYDNICFQYSSKPDEQSFSERYQIHYSYVPLHTYFDLSIKPNKPVPFNLRDKIVLMYRDGKSEDGKAADFFNGWYKAKVRNFGEYRLVADTIAPIISSLQKENENLSRARQIRFSVKEAATSVKKFRAELDGKWLLFEPRGTTFFYDFDERCTKGKHRLVITAADENDNTSTFVYNFTR